ncbi:hypothetical protein HYC85_017486, partial [Camellia sinensis]
KVLGGIPDLQQYRHSHVTPFTWVAWGINPKPNKMVGTHAIIAYQKPYGNMVVYTAFVDSYATQLQEGNLSFLQDGPITSNHLGIHDLSGHHLQSIGAFNLLSGQAFTSHGSDSKTKLKIASSYNALMLGHYDANWPFGGKLFEGGWTGSGPFIVLPPYCCSTLRLYNRLGRSKSSGIHHPCHLGIGIILFSLGLLQDHKYRYLWNLFHHNTGYVVILLSFFNTWLGFNILKPAKEWVITYGVVFGALILSAFLLEVWKKFARDRTGGAHEEVHKSASTSPGCKSSGLPYGCLLNRFLTSLGVLTFDDDEFASLIKPVTKLTVSQSQAHVKGGSFGAGTSNADDDLLAEKAEIDAVAAGAAEMRPRSFHGQLLYANIHVTIHNSNISQDQGYVLYCIDRHLPKDLPEMIVSKMIGDDLLAEKADIDAVAAGAAEMRPRSFHGQLRQFKQCQKAWQKRLIKFSAVSYGVTVIQGGNFEWFAGKKSF